jgi:hypothetical protein
MLSKNVVIFDFNLTIMYAAIKSKAMPAVAPKNDMVNVLINAR